MKAAVFVEPGKIDIQNIPIPKLNSKQMLIKLKGCGVCGSNLPIWQGRSWFTYPFEPGAPGHEGWGVIDGLGNKVEKFKIGQTVGFLSYHSYAEYDLADEDSAVIIPDSLNGFPFAAEPLACAMNVFVRSDIQPGQKVAIVGVGFLGAMLVSLCARMNAEVIAISRRPFSLRIAKDQGAAHMIEMNENSKIIEQIQQLTDGKGCERVIEATGTQHALDIASELTGVRARLIIAGYHQDSPRQVNMQMWNWRGLDVINAHERDKSFYLEGMRSAIRAIQNGTFNPFDLMTSSYPIEQISNAFDDLQNRPDGFLKGYIKF